MNGMITLHPRALLTPPTLIPEPWAGSPPESITSEREDDVCSLSNWAYINPCLVLRVFVHTHSRLVSVSNVGEVERDLKSCCHFLVEMGNLSDFFLNLCIFQFQYFKNFTLKHKISTWSFAIFSAKFYIPCQNLPNDGRVCVVVCGTVAIKVELFEVVLNDAKHSARIFLRKTGWNRADILFFLRSPSPENCCCFCWKDSESSWISKCLQIALESVLGRERWWVWVLFGDAWYRGKGGIIFGEGSTRWN